MDTTPFDPFRPLPPEERHAAFAELRATCPVARSDSGPWIVADYASVEKVFREVDHFVGTFGDAGGEVPEDEQILQAIPEPRHGRLRRIINSVMAPHKIGRAEPFIRALTERLLADAVVAGRLDLVPAFIDPMPTRVIGHVLGIPEDDWERFRRFSDEFLERMGRAQQARPVAEVHPEFAGYVASQIAARRSLADPPDDLITRFINAEIDGERLSDASIRSQVMMLIIAGSETTRNMLGNLFFTLASEPALFARMRAERRLIPLVVEESLRHDSPAQILARSCTTGIDVGGVRLATGDRVVVGVASANRDERVFDAPDDFRPERPNLREHIAFGRGPHICPGASLARLEGTVALEVACDLVGAMRLAPGYTFDPKTTFFAHGPRSLDIELVPAATNAVTG